MSWIKTISEDSLPPGKGKVLKLKRRKILLLNHQGKFYAVDHLCPHIKLPLQQGKVTHDGAIICPWHRCAFDLATGDVKDGCPWPPDVYQRNLNLSRKNVLPNFPIKIEEGIVYIEIASAK